MAEDLLIGLSKIDDLKVAARTSAFSFKGADVGEIGERLSVRNILEGSVRRAGNRLRISVQLVNAAEGWKKAIEFFKKAVEIQPDYAPAFAEMASAWGCLWFFGILPAEQSIPKWRTAADRALKIDENISELHLSLGLMTFFYYWKWEKAEQ